MSSPHILQNGVPRSGNVWLFYLIRNLLTAANIPVEQYISRQEISRVLAKKDLGIHRVAESDFIVIQPQRCYYTILDVFRWPIRDMREYIEQTTQVASHSPWNSASAEVYSLFSHGMYIVRDPRDAALSMARFAFTDFNRLHRPPGFKDPASYLEYHFSGFMQRWVEHVEGHLVNLAKSNMRIVFYEALVADLPGQVRQLADFLGVALDAAGIEAVVAASSFGEISAQQPNHTHRGVWGGWREELSRVQKRQAEKIAGSLLAVLGYPEDPTVADTWSVEDLHLPK